MLVSFPRVHGLWAISLQGQQTARSFLQGQQLEIEFGGQDRFCPVAFWLFKALNKWFTVAAEALSPASPSPLYLEIPLGFLKKFSLPNLGNI